MRSLALLLLTCASAQAWVPTQTAAGVPVRWSESCVFLHLDSQGSLDVPAAELRAALQRAVADWTSSSCSYLQLKVGDGGSAVRFLHDYWPHKSGLLALTTLSYVDGGPGDGSILEALIELNEVEYTFTTRGREVKRRAGTSQLANLEDTLAHELGHVIGFAHTTDPKSIMFPNSSSDELLERQPNEDDLRGLCESYSANQRAPACYGEVEGGCEVSGGRRGLLWALLMLAAIAIRQIHKRLGLAAPPS